MPCRVEAIAASYAAVVANAFCARRHFVAFDSAPPSLLQFFRNVLGSLLER